MDCLICKITDETLKIFLRLCLIQKDSYDVHGGVHAILCHFLHDFSMAVSDTHRLFSNELFESMAKMMMQSLPFIQCNIWQNNSFSFELSCMYQKGNNIEMLFGSESLSIVKLART